MSGCKQYQRHLAFYSVRALDEAHAAEALAHQNHCPECREYWQRLQFVVNAYGEDAERSILPTHGPLVLRSLPERQLFTWRRAAALATAAFVFGVLVFLTRERPSPPSNVSAASQSAPVSVVSIGDARHLLNKDLEAWPELLERHERSESVFSVATRNEDL
jgi:hypothetical protein